MTSRFARGAAALGPWVVFAALVMVVLGPSLAGVRVALPRDLLFEHLPWSHDPPPAAVEGAANPELRDLIDHYYPLQQRIVAGWRSGTDVSWLPDVGLGYPGWMFLGSGALSPFQLPALVLPFDLAWSWGMGLRLFVAMGGAYVLARSFRIGRAGATVAGVAYGLCGYMVGWLGWPQAHVGALLPWMWVATRACVHPHRRWWSLPALALVTGGLWLAGFPAVTVYGLGAAAVVALHAAWTHRRGLAAWAAGLAVAAGGVVAGTALVAFSLLPTAALLGQFDLGVREDMWQARVPGEGLLTFLVPRFFGHVGADSSWLPVAHVETIGYVGVVTLALAVAAWLLGPRRPGVALTSGLAVAFAAVAYGLPPLPWLISHLPALSTNPPPRVLVVVGLALALLGGFGADALVRWSAGRARVHRAAVWAAAGMVLLAGAATAVGRPLAQLQALAHERLRDPELLARALAVARNETGVAVGFLAAGLVVVLVARGLAGRWQRVGTALMAVGLVVVVAADLGRFASGWNVQAPRGELVPDAPGVAELVDVSARHRVATVGDVGLPNTHLQAGFRDLRAHAFLTPRHRAVLERMDVDLRSATRWELSALRSSGWEPWLTMLGVRRLLVADWVDQLPAPFEQAGAETPIGPLTGDERARASIRARQDEVLVGVQLRVGTYGRSNPGWLQVRARAGEDTSTGRLRLADLADSRVATVPVPDLDVAAGQRVDVEVSATTAQDSGAGVAVFGRDDHGQLRPNVALVFAGDRAYTGRDVGPVRVYDNPDAPPLVYAATDVRGVDHGRALDELASMAPDELAGVVVVEALDGKPLADLPDAGDAVVSEWSLRGGVAQATVEADEAAVVVVQQQTVDGWTASVDGQPAELVRANHLFLGVLVPPGGGEVVLRYVPPGLLAGTLVSLTAALALVAGSAWSWRRRRHGPSAVDASPAAGHR